MPESQDTKLRVLHLPLDAGNPYQQLLADHLGELGVNVACDRLRWRVGRLARQHGAHIVHLHWLHMVYKGQNCLKGAIKIVLVLGQLLVLRLRGVRIFWTAHNLTDHEHASPRLNRFVTAGVIRLAHRIVAHGPTAQRQIVRQFPASKDKIDIIPHGNYIGHYPNNLTRAQARKQLGLDEQQFVFLFLGQIRPYKGVLELIDAVERLDRPCRLIIAGKPIDEETEQAVRQRLDGADGILYRPGFVADADIQLYMNACDAAVYPYRDILSSGSVLLAMSFARCCVAVRRGCIADVLDDQGAFLYDADDNDALPDALNRALESADKTEQMGQHNRMLAEQWSWAHVARLTLDAYERCR